MDEPKRPLPRKRRFYRFSLASLLLFTAILSGYFSGYRLGWRQVQQDQQDLILSTRSYDVADLIQPIDAQPGWSAKKEDFAPLTELITSTVSAEEWFASGAGVGVGVNRIHAVASNSSIIVAGPGAVHRELAELLQQLRDLRYKLPDDYVVTAREVADRQAPARQIIKALTACSRDDQERMKNHFSSALKTLAVEFGQPDQIVSAGEHGYPDWIGSQRIAVWTRGTGKLYFALVDCRPEGEALVIGWWEESVGPLKPIVFASTP